MSLRSQRRIAASILKCGVHRVWIDPSRIRDVELAITREDVKRLIDDGAIRKLQKAGIARQKEGRRRKGPGSRKGGIGKKKRHQIRIQKVRALRRTLRELREGGHIRRGAYRKLYLMVKGGMFKSRKGLLRYIETHGLRVEYG